MRKTKPIAFPVLILILDYTGIIDSPSSHWGKLAKLIMTSIGLASYSEEHACNSFYPELGISALTSGSLTLSSIRIICRIWQPPLPNPQQTNKQTSKQAKTKACSWVPPQISDSLGLHIQWVPRWYWCCCWGIFFESALEEVALPACLVINNKAAIGCFCRWSWLAYCLPPKLSSFLLHCHHFQAGKVVTLEYWVLLILDKYTSRNHIACIITVSWIVIAYNKQKSGNPNLIYLNIILWLCI